MIYNFFHFIGFPPNTFLTLYEEIKADFVEKITNYDEPLEKVSIFKKIVLLV